MNQPGGWPRPETGRRVTPWVSNTPSSAIPCLFTPGRGADLESEPARRPGPLRRRIGVRALGFEFSALRSGRCAAGAAAGLEPSRRVTPWGSTPPSSAGRDPAGRRGLPDTQVSLGSTPRRPTQSPWPVAQRSERRPYKTCAAGSTPVRPTLRGAAHHEQTGSRQPNTVTGPASIQAMQLTFNQRTRVRLPGGVLKRR